VNKIRTAILGYGRNGSTMHAGAIEHNHEDFEVVAVSDVDPERRRQAEERFACRTYEDYHTMLAEEQLDLVSVVTRSDQHCRMTCDCLESGANVMVTKPWAVNENEARRMSDAATRSEKLLMPWLPARWGCDYVRLKQLLEEEPIGKVFMIRRSVCGFAARDDWQTELKHGGGYLLNWGLHLIDPPVLLMRAKVSSVYGRLKKAFNPGDGEDLFLALMNLSDGTVVLSEYTVAAEDLPNWFIQGDRGTIVVRDRSLKVHRKDPHRIKDPTDYVAMGASGGVLHEETLAGEIYGDEKEIYGIVARTIRGEFDYPVTHDDMVQLTRVLDAIRRADTENRVVSL